MSFQGTITGINFDTRSMFVKTSSGVLISVRTATTTIVKRNDAAVTFSSLRVGDLTEVTTGADKVATKVEAVGI